MQKFLTLFITCTFAASSMAEYVAPVSTEKPLVEIHVNKDWTLRQRMEVVNKVETEQGISQLGEQKITYNSAHERVSTLRGNQIDYFLGLECGQVPLLSLMQPMELAYAQQMWGFQSSLYYRDQKPLENVDGLTVQVWHDWVLKNALDFDATYPTQLEPFSQSKISLSDIPAWQSEIGDFSKCDLYIENVWGYSAATLKNDIEALEYKALLVHLVYSSLTSAREQLH